MEWIKTKNGLITNKIKKMLIYSERVENGQKIYFLNIFNTFGGIYIFFLLKCSFSVDNSY